MYEGGEEKQFIFLKYKSIRIERRRIRLRFSFQTNLKLSHEYSMKSSKNFTDRNNFEEYKSFVSIHRNLCHCLEIVRSICRSNSMTSVLKRERERIKTFQYYRVKCFIIDIINGDKSLGAHVLYNSRSRVSARPFSSQFCSLEIPWIAHSTFDTYTRRCWTLLLFHWFVYLANGSCKIEANKV